MNEIIANEPKANETLAQTKEGTLELSTLIQTTTNAIANTSSIDTTTPLAESTTESTTEEPTSTNKTPSLNNDYEGNENGESIDNEAAKSVTTSPIKEVTSTEALSQNVTETSSVASSTNSTFLSNFDEYFTVNETTSDEEDAEFDDLLKLIGTTTTLPENVTTSNSESLSSNIKEDDSPLNKSSSAIMTTSVKEIEAENTTDLVTHTEPEKPVIAITNPVEIAKEPTSTPEHTTTLNTNEEESEEEEEDSTTTETTSTTSTTTTDTSTTTTTTTTTTSTTSTTSETSTTSTATQTQTPERFLSTKIQIFSKINLTEISDEVRVSPDQPADLCNNPEVDAITRTEWGNAFIFKGMCNI